MANTKLNAVPRNIVQKAKLVAALGDDLENATQAFTKLAVENKFPLAAFNAPKKDVEGKIPPIVYKGGKVDHQTFWLELKAAIATILPEAQKRYAIHDSFPKYRDATYTAEMWGEMTGNQQQAEKEAYKSARGRINPRIRDVQDAIKRAYGIKPESDSETPEVKHRKSLVTISEKIGKMEATTPKLLTAKKYIDSAIEVLTASD